MSLLSILQGAAKDLGLNKPSSVVVTTDEQTKQLYSLLNRDGLDLLRRFDWQDLTKEATFTTVAAETQTTLAAAASDFFRFVNETMNNRTQHWQVVGPLDARLWQRVKSLGAQVGVRNYFRIRGGDVLFYPTPTAGDDIYFEYISNQWIEASDGTAKAAFTADTDTTVINEDVLTLGVKWRFLRANGMDYSEEFRSYEAALEDLFGADGARAAVDMGGSMVDFDIPMIPDGSWNIT